MARGQGAQIERGAAERGRMDLLTLGEKPVGDSALVQQLDRASVEPATPRAGEDVGLALLENHDIDPCQPQLAGQHHPRRPAADDNHIVHLNLALRHRTGSMRQVRGLAASPPCRGTLEMRGLIRRGLVPGPPADPLVAESAQQVPRERRRRQWTTGNGMRR